MCVCVCVSLGVGVIWKLIWALTSTSARYLPSPLFCPSHAIGFRLTARHFESPSLEKCPQVCCLNYFFFPFHPLSLSLSLSVPLWVVLSSHISVSWSWRCCFATCSCQDNEGDRWRKGGRAAEQAGRRDLYAPNLITLSRSGFSQDEFYPLGINTERSAGSEPPGKPDRGRLKDNKTNVDVQAENSFLKVQSYKLILWRTRTDVFCNLVSGLTVVFTEYIRWSLPGVAPKRPEVALWHFHINKCQLCCSLHLQLIQQNIVLTYCSQTLGART